VDLVVVFATGRHKNQEIDVIEDFVSYCNEWLLWL